MVAVGFRPVLSYPVAGVVEFDDFPADVLGESVAVLDRLLRIFGPPQTQQVDVETPNIDRLAAEGVRFENHFVTAPQCSPSRGSLFTGCYPHVNGLMGLAHTRWELDTEQTLPHLLSESGYDTNLFGLQHISQSPEDLGDE